MAEPSDTTVPKPAEMDVDAEMEDTQDTSAAAGGANTNRNETSSATLDHDFTQSETQPATGGVSSLLNNNRKDVTLREFMSKMDDYAPIVGSALFFRPSLRIARSSQAVALPACEQPQKQVH